MENKKMEQSLRWKEIQEELKLLNDRDIKINKLEALSNKLNIIKKTITVRKTENIELFKDVVSSAIKVMKLRKYSDYTTPNIRIHLKIEETLYIWKEVSKLYNRRERELIKLEDDLKVYSAHKEKLNKEIFLYNNKTS